MNYPITNASDVALKVSGTIYKPAVVQALVSGSMQLLSIGVASDCDVDYEKGLKVTYKDLDGDSGPVWLNKFTKTKVTYKQIGEKWIQFMSDHPNECAQIISQKDLPHAGCVFVQYLTLGEVRFA